MMSPRSVRRAREATSASEAPSQGPAGVHSQQLHRNGATDATLRHRSRRRPTGPFSITQKLECEAPAGPELAASCHYAASTSRVAAVVASRR